MSKLPQVSGTRLVRALGRGGFREVHRRGSHVMLAHRNDATRIGDLAIYEVCAPRAQPGVSAEVCLTWRLPRSKMERV